MEEDIPEIKYPSRRKTMTEDELQRLTEHLDKLADEFISYRIFCENRQRLMALDKDKKGKSKG